MNLYSSDGEEGVVDCGSLGRFLPVRHQLLNGHPVVQDLLVPLLHHLAVAELDDAGLRASLSAAERILPEALQPAPLHELSPPPLLLGPQEVLLALFLAPVASHLHLTHGIVISRHAAAALLLDLESSLPQESVPDGPLGDVPTTNIE